MTLFYLLLLLAAGIALLGHLGLPEKKIPPPPAPRPEHIMQGAEPWRFEGDSGVAFLVCHGFRGSPFNVKPLGEFLHSLGHTAIGPLLPGHGTRVEDMRNSRFEHYVEFLERLYLDERSKYRKLFLVGFSMGGTICLKVAAKNADTFRPTGIITIASPVFFNGFFNGRFIMHQPATALSGLLKIVQPIVKLEINRPRTAEKLMPWVGYAGEVSMHALHSLKTALGGVRRGLGRISVPDRSIIAANDRTVSAENQIYVHNHIQSREKRAYMFILPPDLTSMHPILTHVRARERVFHFVESFVNDTLEDYSSDPDSDDSFSGRLRRWFAGRPALRKPDDLVRGSR